MTSDYPTKPVQVKLDQIFMDEYSDGLLDTWSHDIDIGLGIVDTVWLTVTMMMVVVGVQEEWKCDWLG